MIFAGETEVLGENLPSATLSTTNPTWIDPGANPGLRDERPATNRLRNGTTSGIYCLVKLLSTDVSDVLNETQPDFPEVQLASAGSTLSHELSMISPP
jgi:hypothetical protein